MTLAPHKKLRERKDAAQGVTPSLAVYSSVNARCPAETVQRVNPAIAPFRLGLWAVCKRLHPNSSRPDSENASPDENALPDLMSHINGVLHGGGFA
jgi:hypothetical protein